MEKSIKLNSIFNCFNNNNFRFYADLVKQHKYDVCDMDLRMSGKLILHFESLIEYLDRPEIDAIDIYINHPRDIIKRTDKYVEFNFDTCKAIAVTTYANKSPKTYILAVNTSALELKLYRNGDIELDPEEISLNKTLEISQTTSLLQYIGIEPIVKYEKPIVTTEEKLEDELDNELEDESEEIVEETTTEDTTEEEFIEEEDITPRKGKKFNKAKKAKFNKQSTLDYDEDVPF